MSTDERPADERMTLYRSGRPAESKLIVAGDDPQLPKQLILQPVLTEARAPRISSPECERSDWLDRRAAIILHRNHWTIG